MGDGGEGREDGFEGEGVGSLREHEGHAGAEEDDFGGGRVGEVFAFEVSVRRRGRSARRSW